MKYSKKRDRFEASNVWFSQTNMLAKSYDWWVFVKEIQGVIYFNNFGYSVTTKAHQRKVSNLLDSLGIKVQVISFQESLASASTKEQVVEFSSRQMKRDSDLAEFKRVDRLKKAKLRREKLKAESLAKPLATIIQMRA